MENINVLFWQSTIEEIQQGFIYRKRAEDFMCLICGESFKDGMIYRNEDQYMDAKMIMKNHILEQHGSVFDFLLNLSKRYTGLTEIQKEIMEYLYLGLTDKEIIKKQGGKSPATIRNHRFKFREKEKQARIYLALIGLLELSREPGENPEELIDVHRRATMVDDRYVITQGEREKILNSYLVNGKVSSFPSKEKKKLVILQYIMEAFSPNMEYSEKEVNDIIKQNIDDYVAVRRYLIQYGYMDRERDGSRYWINE